MSSPMEGSRSCSPLINYSTKGPYISFQETALTDHHGQAEEESGWTTYLQDFSKYRPSTPRLEHHISFTSRSLSLGSSLISDAASRYHDLPMSPPDCLGYNQAAGTKKLSLVKNRMPKKLMEEEEEENPLEDTASSPVSTPTILDDHKRMDNISRRGGRGSSSYHHHHGIVMESIDGGKEKGPKGQNRVSSTTGLLDRTGDCAWCLCPCSQMTLAD
ncbi:hypothetical protein SAY86_011553 [Trapa natans]|uniref:Uncharacterized protein n=1 Tax=Trapa natans TaxID=22666 RepID=A0AAN7LVA6_TRANT|nr:hypothetical protein SAY86_011553 [Trapa natans]